jgi:hypothetical protein
VGRTEKPEVACTIEWVIQDTTRDCLPGRVPRTGIPEVACVHKRMGHSRLPEMVGRIGTPEVACTIGWVAQDMSASDGLARRQGRTRYYSVDMICTIGSMTSKQHR